ncbi:ATP-binding protein [Xylanimonas ulmi]|uniref:ATP-binding protein n=1 Tax=Xylanimonas ulmi TaxID=228973 RepID=UPI00102BFDE2|nr:ATP-binding protein [Xylanibacterium ulmi]
MSSPTAPAGVRPRLPLRRPEAGRWVAGVCAGLAAHLGVPVVVVRVAIALLTPVGGAGLAVYIFWWVTIPAGDPRAAADAAADAAAPAALRRIAPRLRLSGPVARMQRRDIVVGLVLLTVAALLVSARAGWQWRQSWVVPALLALGGLALAWSQVDAAQRGASVDGARGWPAIVRPAGGLVLVVAGALLLVGQDTPGWAVLQSATAALVVLVGFALVAAPWWLRLVRELGDERAARAREAERADIAAHLHDSVLQTLALIRSRADDADSVARMARAQERELREWLYDDRQAPGTSLAAELRTLVAQVEDGTVGKPVDGAAPAGRPVAVDVVVVGDCPPTDATTALLQATREALVNAVAHGKPPVTVYLEVTEREASVFVRDRGDGFTMDDVAPDRFGVRESILGRVRRRGGTAEVTSRAGWGTEVRLRMPRAAVAAGAANGTAPNGTTPTQSAPQAAADEGAHP